jgi:hypothetical protein
MSNERDSSTEWKWDTILKFLSSPFWIVSILLSLRLLHGGPRCDFINIYKKCILKVCLMSDVSIQGGCVRQLISVMQPWDIYTEIKVPSC